jgi:LysM repeat protein
MRQKKSGLLVLLLVSHSLFGQNLPDSLVRKEFNFIQFPSRNAINTAYQAWKNSKHKRFTVLHLGDSHLQNENLPNKARALAQNQLGDGGIGLIQPFSIVKSYDASFYKSKHTGNWEYAKSYLLPPKLPLGVRGMTAKTKEVTASFTIQFNKSTSEANNLLTVFLENNPTNYTPLIYADSVLLKLVHKEAGIEEYDIPSKFKTLHLTLEKSNDAQDEFILYGLSLSNQSNEGVIWHNAGVGASQYKSILFEEKYDEQAKYLNPDLVIIDFGTNDFLYSNKIPDNLKSEIERVIAKVKKASPSASIVLTSAQDMVYKGRKITAAQEFSNLMKQIALESNTGFWDWYQIAGGPTTMDIWTANSHSMKDGIHLNGKGSMVKGSLLFSAFENTFSKLDSEPELKELQIDAPVSAPKEEMSISELVKVNKREIKPSHKHRVITVKKGQNLSQIAEDYHISVNQLKKINNLKSDKISIGQKLRVDK